jgi:hypothetical protein
LTGASVLFLCPHKVSIHLGIFPDKLNEARVLPILNQEEETFLKIIAQFQFYPPSQKKIIKNYT